MADVVLTSGDEMDDVNQWFGDEWLSFTSGLGMNG